MDIDKKQSKRSLTAAIKTRSTTLSSDRNAAKSHFDAPKPNQNVPRASNGQPRVYSYARFSTPDQASGDSKRRQLDAAEKFAKEKGMPLDESLIDEGLSGYHGTNRKNGALGAFLEKVESGLVASGSILLIENFDRFSREPAMTAVETVNALLKKGITIVTLTPRDEFTLENVNRNGGIYRLIPHIERAHAESARKADYAKANWQQKRKAIGDKILTKRAPAWLEFNEGKFSVITGAGEAIKLLFKLKLDGIGKNRIAQILNERAVWSPPKNKKRKSHGWRGSYIEKILRNRAVLGEFQPHRINEEKKRIPEGEAVANYFPSVIKPQTWHAVQARMEGNKSMGGRTGKALNLFQNLVKCGYCGGSMVFVNKGSTNKGGKFLYCDDGRRGVLDANGKPKCRSHHVGYEEFQDTMLNNLRKLRPETVLPNQDEVTERSAELRENISGLKGELNATEGKINNLVDQIELSSDRAIRERYEKRVMDLQTHQQQLRSEIKNKEIVLHDLERSGESFRNWQQNIDGLKIALAEDVDTRLRLRAHLKEFINRVEVFATGDERNLEYVEDVIDEHLPELVRSNSYMPFRRYLRKRLLSVEARLYTLHLKVFRPDRQSWTSKSGRKFSAGFPRETGIRIAPVSSLSGGASLRPERSGWNYHEPDIKALFKEFFDARKPGFVPKASMMYNR